MGCENGKFLTLSPPLRSVGRGGGCTGSVTWGASAIVRLDHLKGRNEGTTDARFELLEPLLPIEESSSDDSEDSSESGRVVWDEAGGAVGGSNDDGLAGGAIEHASAVVAGNDSGRMTGPSQASEDSRSPP